MSPNTSTTQYESRCPHESVKVTNCDTDENEDNKLGKYDAVVTCEIKLFSNDFEIISVFDFTCYM